MEQGSTGRAKGVQNRPGEDRKWSENAKKMFFSGNELKDLLTLKDLEFFRPKNELVFEGKKRLFKRRRRQKNAASLVVGSFATGALSTRRSFPQKRESIPQTLGNALSKGLDSRFRGNDLRPTTPLLANDATSAIFQSLILIFRFWPLTFSPARRRNG